MKSGVIQPVPGTFDKPDLYCRRRWRRVQRIADEFWTRWNREYLSSLQPRSKNISINRNLQVGDIVLIKEDSPSRNEWPMARVVKVHFDDKHECVRSVTLRVATQNLADERSIKIRPVNKLVLLLEAEK
jgi:hypothetical protein